MTTSVLSLPLDALFDDLVISTKRDQYATSAGRTRRYYGNQNRGDKAIFPMSVTSNGESLYDEAIGPRHPRTYREIRFIFADPVGDEVATRIGAQQQVVHNVRTNYLQSPKYRRDLAAAERAEKRRIIDLNKASRAERDRISAERRAAEKGVPHQDPKDQDQGRTRHRRDLRDPLREAVNALMQGRYSREKYEDAC